jgi:predicted XRE-type DNA-binding protein
MTDPENINIHLEEDLLSAEKVAEVLEVSKKIVERELREGKLKGFKRLKKWYVFKSDLYAYIRQGGGPESGEEDE